MTHGHSASPPWSPTAKALVAAVGIGLVAALLIRFNAIIPLLVVGGIASYLLLPLIRWLHRRTGMSWRAATNLIFLVAIVLFGVGLFAAGLAVVQQLQALFATLQGLLSTLPARLAEASALPIHVGPLELDLSQFDLVSVAEQALASIQPLLGQVSGLLASAATGAIEILAAMVFVLAVSYFLTIDFERLHASWVDLSIPGLGEDVSRLRAALVGLWNAFLRGQLLIVLAAGVLTGVLMTALGVRFSLGLGVLMGLAKFVPILGPTTAGAVAGLVTLLQPAHGFGLTPVQHAAVVILALVILDQSIDYYMIPRILGSALNMHPVVVLVGAIIGASLAGVIGLLLSSPAMATVLLLGRYAYRKLADLSPWDPPIDAPPAERPPRTIRWLTRRLSGGKEAGPPATTAEE
jgi:predicted PurR-regulated permease PerM